MTVLGVCPQAHGPTKRPLRTRPGIAAGQAVACGHLDLAANPKAALIAWGLPVVAIVFAALAADTVFAAVAAGAFTWMGIACLWNAASCRRTHCFITGPYFLLTALAILLARLELLPGFLASAATSATALAVGGLLAWLPERRFGKYRNEHARLNNEGAH